MKGFFTSLDERERSAAEVDGVFRSNAALTAEKMIEWLEPELLQGETMPDVELLQLLVQRALARRSAALSEAGETLLELRQEVQEEKAAAVDAAREARAQVVDLRAAFKGFFGTRRASNFLGLRGATSRDPIALEKQARRAAARLRDETRELQPARLAVGELDRESLARPLEHRADALDEAETRLVSARKHADMAQLLKDRALADYNETFVRVTTWFVGLYRLVGLNYLARAVRPSGHRKGRTFADVQRRRKKPRNKAGEDSTASTAEKVTDVRALPAAVEARPLEIAAPEVEPEVIEVATVESGRARLLPFAPLRRALRFFGRPG